MNKQKKFYFLKIRDFFCSHFIYCFILIQYGCSTPHIQDDERVVKISLTKTSNETLTISAFEVGDWPQENWWEMFDDPQLGHLIEQAMQDNPTLHKVEAKVKTALAFVQKERSAFFPDIGATAETNWQYLGKNSFFRSFAPTVPSTLNQIDLFLNFNYEFDFWGRNLNLYRTALNQARAEEAEYNQTKLILSSAIAQAYFNLQRNLQKLDILKQIHSLRTTLFELMALRSKFALDNDIPKIDSQKNELDVTVLIKQREQDVALSIHLLQILIGQEPDASLHLKRPSSTFNKAFPIPQQIGLDLIARRPDLMAQIWRVEAAAHKIGVAKADFFPNVNLSVLGGLESLQFNTLFSAGSKIASFFPAIHLPIFTGGRLTANLRTKEAEYDQAVYEYNEMLLQAARQIVDEITIIKFTDSQLDIQNSTLNALEMQHKLVISRFNQGLDNYLMVLRNQETVLNQKMNIIELRYERLLSRLKLIKALGGGYFSSAPIAEQVANQREGG